MSRLELEGRGVLVAGATGGIGKAVARELAERGAKVALLARPTERLERAVDELAEHGAIGVPADVTDRGQVVAAADEAAERLGGLAAVVAGAGTVVPDTIGQQPEEDARRVIDVNLYGTLWTIQAALPHVDRSGGHLLALASISGITPVPLTGLYSATKAAVGELVAQLRIELMHRETSAGVVYFGMVDTQMSEGVKQDERVERALSATPGGVTRPLKVEDAARRVVHAIEHRQRAVVTPVWQLPFAAPQLGMQAVVETGMRVTAIARELPGRRQRAPFDDAGRDADG
ncbi:SDR family oxidoreductase [Patulibacter sp. S7RM1-6]